MSVAPIVLIITEDSPWPGRRPEKHSGVTDGLASGMFLDLLSLQMAP